VSTPGTFLALLNDDGIVEQLALFTGYAAFQRDEGDWLVVDEDDDPFTGLHAVDTIPLFVETFDMAQDTDAILDRSDVPQVKE
jgi:hypothetical protein